MQNEVILCCTYDMPKCIVLAIGVSFLTMFNFGLEIKLAFEKSSGFILGFTNRLENDAVNILSLPVKDFH